MNTFDITVIGSGPGGYVAAIRAAQLGFKTALIEKYNSLGGTCLNVGCIPSKALLDSSHHYEDAITHFTEHGIELNGKPIINFPQMVARKNAVISQTVEGIQYLMKKNNITVFNGLGAFKDATHLTITKEDGSVEEIESKYSIIATGSKPTELPFMKFDKQQIISSTEALSLPEIPKHLIVIGGGVIGLEMGTVYKRLGAEVTIIEFAPKVIPTMDESISKEMLKLLKKKGFALHLNTKVTGATVNGNEVTVTATNDKGEDLSFTGDYCLVSVGRKPYTEGLGLENAGVETDERGFVKVNTHLQTNIANIYAIGDVIGGQMLAHKAEEEGVLVTEFLAGQKPHINYNLIPGVVYTWPEAAGVGQTEQQLKEKGIAYKSGSFPMKALGRARASMETEGLVKVLTDAQTDEILGVHILGARAADMIAEAVVAMEFRASAEDIARMSHAHPTFTEAIKEAALDATEKRALHI